MTTTFRGVTFREVKIKLAIIIALFLLGTALSDFFSSGLKTEGAWEWLFTSVAFYFVLPVVVIKSIFKDNPWNYHFEFSLNLKKTFLILIVAACYVATMWLFVVIFNWKGALLVSKWILGSAELLLFVNLLIAPVALFCKEFFFRGFLLKFFLQTFNVPFAIVVQALLALVADLWVWGVASWQAALGLLLLNIFLGIIALTTRSIWISTLVSWLHLLIIDLGVLYQFSSGL